MDIQVSGKRIQVEDGITVMQLMQQQKVAVSQNVTVSLNKAFLPVERYECYALQEGDTVEFKYHTRDGSFGADR